VSKRETGQTARPGRAARVAQAIKANLVELIDREVKDPRVKEAGLMTLSQVELNKDMTVATVYISLYGDERVADDAVEALVNAAGKLRGSLGRRMHMARAPELRFVRDQSLAFSARLRDIVREDEEKAAQASGEPDEDAVDEGAPGDAAPEEEEEA